MSRSDSRPGGVAAGDAAIISETGLATFNAATTSLTDKIMSVEAGIQTGVAAAAGQTAVFNHDGAAYLFISEGTDGVGAGDMLIKLVGITATTGLTIDGSGDLIGVA